MSNDYPNTCNDCKFSTSCGWSTHCHNKGRPKSRTKEIGYVANSRRRSVHVKPTWSGCDVWEQGQASQQIFKSPF